VKQENKENISVGLRRGIETPLLHGGSELQIPKACGFRARGILSSKEKNVEAKALQRNNVKRMRKLGARNESPRKTAVDTLVAVLTERDA